MELLKGFVYQTIEVGGIISTDLSAPNWQSFASADLGTSQGNVDEVRLYAIDGSYILLLNNSSTGEPDYILAIRPGESVNISRFTGMTHFAVLGGTNRTLDGVPNFVDQTFAIVAYR